MMKFFTILATVFSGGTFWVGAYYYIEFRAPPPITTVRGAFVRTNYLYLCKGVPDGEPAFTARTSRCSRVTDWTERIYIYYNCNFYSVHRPDLQNHVIQFSDRPYRSNIEWSVGYLYDAIDHPDFGAPSQLDIEFAGAKVERLGVGSIVPSDFVEDLTFYFAQNNLIAFSENFLLALGSFMRFTAFLRRLMERRIPLSQDPNVSRAALTQGGRFERAIKLCLQKMIDPCAVLHLNFQPQANEYCATYCNFLGYASQHFYTCTSRCSSIQGGQCQGAVCTCNRVLTNPFTGCDPLNSPMRMCHNSLREELNDLDSQN